MIQDVRFEQLKQWVRSLPGWENTQFEVASADASFRRYFRALNNHKTAIVMDAPPELEDSSTFIDITRRLLDAEAHAPVIIADNLSAGFLLLQDFGSTPLLSELTPTNADQHYRQAIQELLKLQIADTTHLPVYDVACLREEMDLMPEWFLVTHLNLGGDIPQALIEQTFSELSHAVHAQPVVFVHRDYHSRNLMLTDGHIGVIDYQDAVLGPMTYDLVSLLRDCYVAWPEQQVTRWALSFHKEAIKAGNIPPVNEAEFMRWFDLTGLQRHIKVLGIFSRLNHRDGKSAYLNDLPLVLSYVLSVGSRHPETSQLVEWMRSAGIPERIGTVNTPA
uniref:COG3178: Predicted phosphotransferase related to Ser/Thr protein kinases n=1 Tax=uncultured Thiotrichaceae bacterium TaxID=298394 RepID=A0A6S6UMH9_9GAMM|nr:MAG: COG3178: Predicted phosphotransferase related to Ser/Thr protein kinases [uncultured Thiotrichaceae bacterium]